MQFLESIRIFTLLLLLIGVNGSPFAAELLMVESDDCPYCDQFHAEIGPAYPKTAEGKLAPLKIVKLGEPMPAPYNNIEPARFTPTFILVQDNKEIDRLIGYPGDNYFWFLLGEMLDKLKS